MSECVTGTCEHEHDGQARSDDELRQVRHRPPPDKSPDPGSRWMQAESDKIMLVAHGCTWTPFKNPVSACPAPPSRCRLSRESCTQRFSKHHSVITPAVAVYEPERVCRRSKCCVWQGEQLCCCSYVNHNSVMLKWAESSMARDGASTWQYEVRAQSTSIF
jgi:hypothetical protein